MLPILIDWPVIDLLAALAWYLSVRLAWRNFSPPERVDCIEERSLGATVILSQLNGVLTGSTIIMAGVGAFIVLASAGGTLAGPAASHAFYAALWAVSGMAFAVYTMGILPTRARKQNFVLSYEVAWRSAMALFFVLAAGVRFMASVFGFLYAGDPVAFEIASSPIA